ncbi:b(0,+)-type amino acid transporter 1-like [Oscarella lobularis]|uniref:b(0,+)-type amino acid transporter 1-like n=1 Tax=Oscarella lobularis TaxID=121494 RepID=UPI0033136FF4
MENDSSPFLMEMKETEKSVEDVEPIESERKSKEETVPKEEIKLKKKIGLMHAIGMMAGGIIGSGIFFTPHTIYSLSGSVGMSMAVWIVSGLIALGGGLCYCELGVAFPESGAEYVYLNAAYGPAIAFQFLWMAFILIRPVSQATITLAFAVHVAQPFYEKGCEPDGWAVSLIGIALTVFLGILSARSVKASVVLQSWLAAFKVVALAIIVGLAIYWLSKGETGSITEKFDHTTSSVGKISLAFYQSLWAYDGWNALNFVAEEIPNPPKNFPRAAASAVFLVIGCYVCVNIAYFVLLTREEFLLSPAVAITIGEKVWGDAGLIVMPLAVALSCLGASASSLFVASRLIYAAGRKGHLPSFLGLLHPDYRSPIPAILFQSILASLYILVGNYDVLIDAFSFVIWIFYLATFVSIYVIRYRMPNAHRPHKVWTWLPAVMIIVSIFLIVVPVIQAPIYLLTLLGFIPGFFFYFVVLSGRWKFSLLTKANATLKRIAIHLCNLG